MPCAVVRRLRFERYTALGRIAATVSGIDGGLCEHVLCRGAVPVKIIRTQWESAIGTSVGPLRTDGPFAPIRRTIFVLERSAISVGHRRKYPKAVRRSRRCGDQAADWAGPHSRT